MNRLSRDVEEIKEIVSTYLKVEKDTLDPIVSGEGIILKNGDKVYKCLTLFNEQTEMMKMALRSEIEISADLLSLHSSFLERDLHILHNYLRLKSLSESMKRSTPERIVDFDVFMADGYVFLVMPYVETTSYLGGLEDEIVSLLREFKSLQWITTDLTPKNIRLRREEPHRIIFIDIGYFFVPFYDELFETTCRRAYVCMNYATDPIVKDLLRSVNQDDGFRDFPNSEDHQESFAEFLTKVRGHG
ncbi:MAG: hypothetical protein E3J35_09500 [Methanomassiliicoccales archaeon]|nr:MAG: hypothetical protein E3J35_09500 [Methanomassiliicoccales archaeon]